VFVAASLAWGASAQGRLLRYHANEGSTAVYDHKLSGRLDLTEEAGQKGRVEITTQARCNVEFLGGTASGDIGLRGLIEPRSSTVITDGRKEIVQSSEVAARYLVNPQGRVKSISWLTGGPMLDSMDEGVSVTPEDIFLLGGAAILPDKPVKTGDKWSGSVKGPGALAGEDETIKYESTLLGEETFRGALCARIKTKATISGSASEDAPDGSGRAVVSAKATTVATWLFDPERGMITSVDESDQLSMTIKIIQDEGVLAKVTMAGVINTRSTLTEYNGAPVGPT
jgi:hypothetical protein